MQNEYSKALNQLLVEGFRAVQKIEEKMIRSAHGIDLTINELHMLETVGKSEQGATVSDIAKELQITMPSVTVATKKLEAKGYLVRVKNEEDARKVYLVLTESGKQIDRIHQYFHERMVRSIVGELSENDKKVFFDSIYKLDQFFKQQVDKIAD